MCHARKNNLTDHLKTSGWYKLIVCYFTYGNTENNVAMMSFKNYHNTKNKT